MPRPITGERPSAYADRVGQWYAATVTGDHKKNFGQYLTPLTVADYMAGLFETHAQFVRILDPGAGTGILSCALCERLASGNRPPSELELIAYETDKNNK